MERPTGSTGTAPAAPSPARQYLELADRYLDASEAPVGNTSCEQLASINAQRGILSALLGLAELEQQRQADLRAWVEQLKDALPPILGATLPDLPGEPRP